MMPTVRPFTPTATRLLKLATLPYLLLLLLAAPATAADDNYFNEIVPDTPEQAGLPTCNDSQVLAMVHADVERRDPSLRIESVEKGAQNNRALYFAHETGVYRPKARFCEAVLTYNDESYMLLFYRVRWRDIKPNEAGIELYHAIELF